MNHNPIVIFGSLNVDLVVQAPRLLCGETLPGDRFVVVPGGKGANQAIGAARQGGRVAMIGCVGRRLRRHATGQPGAGGWTTAASAAPPPAPALR